MASKKPNTVERLKMHNKCIIRHFSALYHVMFGSSSHIWLTKGSPNTSSASHQKKTFSCGEEAFYKLTVNGTIEHERKGERIFAGTVNLFPVYV